MREVLVVGSLAYDSVKTPSGKAERSLGGSANYFSVAASLFSKVRVVGVVGDDYSVADKSILLQREVDLAGLQTVAGKTFHWEGSYEGNLNEAKTLKTELNVFEHFNPKLPESFKDAFKLPAGLPCFGFLLLDRGGFTAVQRDRSGRALFHFRDKPQSPAGKRFPF